MLRAGFASLLGYSWYSAACVDTVDPKARAKQDRSSELKRKGCLDFKLRICPPGLHFCMSQLETEKLALAAEYPYLQVFVQCRDFVESCLIWGEGGVCDDARFKSSFRTPWGLQQQTCKIWLHARSIPKLAEYDEKRSCSCSSFNTGCCQQVNIKYWLLPTM